MDVDVAEEVTVSDVNLTIKDDESEQDEEEDEGEKWRKKNFRPRKKNFFENFVKSNFLRTQWENYGILLWEQNFRETNFCKNQKECKMISRKDFKWEWIFGFFAI